MGLGGLELASYPWYRPIKKPAADRTPIGRGTATVNTAIGQSARVTHGYRLHQQRLRSISPPWLPLPRRVTFRLSLGQPPFYPPLAHSRTYTPNATPARLATITSRQNSRGQPLFFASTGYRQPPLATFHLLTAAQLPARGTVYS